MHSVTVPAATAIVLGANKHRVAVFFSPDPALGAYVVSFGGLQAAAEGFGIGGNGSGLWVTKDMIGDSIMSSIAARTFGGPIVGSWVEVVES